MRKRNNPEERKNVGKKKKKTWSERFFATDQTIDINGTLIIARC